MIKLLKRHFKKLKFSSNYRAEFRVQLLIFIITGLCWFAGTMATILGQIQINDYLNYSLAIVLFLVGTKEYVVRYKYVQKMDATDRIITQRRIMKNE